MEDSAEGDSDQRSHEAQDPVPHEAAQHMIRRERRHRKKMIIFIVGGAVLTLLLAAAGYWFLTRDKNETTSQAVAKTQGQPEEANPTQADPTPVTYKSTKLNIELTHRKDWTLKETADGEISVVSPRTSYAAADGQSATGAFTVKIRKGVPSPMKATIEKAVAARDSEVIAYTAPAEGQRQYTNLSYAGQKDMFSFFIVTGSTEFKAGSAFAYTLSLDSEFYLIAGGYGTDKDGTLEFEPVPVGSVDTAALEQAVDIVESLEIY